VTFILKHFRRFQNSFLRFWVIPVPKLYKTPVYGGQLRLANQHFISSAVLPHGQKFLIDPQACLREDAHDVTQAWGAVALNALLFGPSYLVRLK